MPSDAPKKSQNLRAGALKGPAKDPLAIIDTLIGSPAEGKPGRKPKGRLVLLAHAHAQRENRLIAEKRAAASKLNAKSEQPASPPATASAPVRPEGRTEVRPEAARQAPERAGLDAVIVKALGASARGHVRDGAFDRESALTDLIARTQTRLGTAGKAPPAAAPAQPAAPTQLPLPVFEPRGDRESMIAAAIRTHRERQAVFDELSLRQRATLRATAEALVAKSASRG